MSKFARDRSLESNCFEFPVTEHCKCPICFNVLDNPKGCRNNQHYFCFACIGRHLKNNHTCPTCMDELTPETLVDPPRVLLSIIQELRVKCSYSTRGCPEYVQLGRLQNHVDECLFAPAVCENEGCGKEVNKGDKVRHETEQCKFRTLDCHGCAELKKEMQDLRRNQEKAVKRMDEHQEEMDRRMAVMVERVKEGVKEILTGNLHAKVNSVLNDAVRASSSHAVRPPINHDIFVMGGSIDKKIVNSVEMFSCKEGRWLPVVPMIVARKAASSVIFENQIIVSGGSIDVGKEEIEPTDSIEILSLDKHPFEWKMSAVKLPVPAASHQTFLFQGNLIVVCHTINKIFQVQLSAPQAAKELCTLPGNLDYTFTAELVDDKIFIFGSSSYSRNVLVYDLVANEFLNMPTLPFIWFLMSSVTWSNQVVLLGGRKREGQMRFDDAADVIMYDTETGESEVLPAMKHTRNGCSAVLVDGMIVVMGGYSNSVEYYDFHTNAWKALKAMKMTRYKATAVVSPLPGSSD